MTLSWKPVLGRYILEENLKYFEIIRCMGGGGTSWEHWKMDSNKNCKKNYFELGL